VNKTNNKSGSAYLFVLIAALLIFMLVTIALTVSVSSRRLTAYYPDHANLYGLAIAGNEQVFLFLSEVISLLSEDTTHEEAMALLTAALSCPASDCPDPDCPNPGCPVPPYPRQWEITVTIAPEGEPTISDTFTAITTVTTLSDRFRTETRIRRYPMDTRTIVSAYILLDGLTLRMVHSKRIIE